MGRRLAASAALSIVMVMPTAFADEVHLTNGDRLSGQIISEGPGTLILAHEAAGSITVETAFIDRIVRDATAEEAIAPTVLPPAAVWDRTLSLGYDVTRGNTINEAFATQLAAHRKTDHDAWTVKIQGYYSETDQRMTSQRYSGMGRYASSFGSRMAWYNFYKLEGDHDRFANVNWRLTPSTGIGYWFSDTDDWKAMAEVGLGFEVTEFTTSGTDNRSDVVVTPRAFVEKTLFGKSTISEDVTLLPNLSETGAYRLTSETVLRNPLSEQLDLEVKFIDKFESNPAGDSKKNDARFISSLVYSF